MAFTLMSHKFNEPIARVAGGGTCQDEDALEITNFQVEQWRKRALEKHNFTHPETWESTPPTGFYPWTILLYLRANAVRGILLRPLFLSNSNRLATKQVKPGLEIVSDSINILSILHRRTDIYKKHHPHFQHFLASSCALLFLIIAYTEQNRVGFPSDTLADYLESVRRNFKMALSLSAAYNKSSHASHKLWKRTISMREYLLRQDILSREDVSGDTVSGAAATHQTAPICGSKKAEMPTKAGDRQQTTIFPNFDGNDFTFFDMPGPGMADTANLLPGFALAGSEDNTSPDFLDPLMLKWPINTTSMFFSDGGF